MKEIIKKYGKKAISAIMLFGIMVLPVMAGATNWETPLTNVANTAGLQSGSTSLTSIIGAIIGTLLAILGVILVLIIIYAGFLWMTAQGDAAKVKKGKDMIIQAIVGLLIVFAAYALTNFIMGALTDISGGRSAENF